MLTILAIALFILNVGTISALILGKPKHPPGQEGHGPKEVIIDRLKFDKAQVAQYQALIEKHKTQIEERETKLKSYKNELYQLLQSGNKSKEDLLIQLIGSIQMEIEQINFSHFEDIKTICKPEQLENFNAFTADLARLFNKKPPKKK
ncbi:MAG: protein CpxP [Saprospiraceae bacterium]|jgi:protein CpxP